MASYILDKHAPDFGDQLLHLCGRNDKGSGLSQVLVTLTEEERRAAVNYSSEVSGVCPHSH